MNTVSQVSLVMQVPGPMSPSQCQREPLPSIHTPRYHCDGQRICAHVSSESGRCGFSSWRFSTIGATASAAIVQRIAQLYGSELYDSYPALVKQVRGRSGSKSELLSHGCRCTLRFRCLCRQPADYRLVVGFSCSFMFTHHPPFRYQPAHGSRPVLGLE